MYCYISSYIIPLHCTYDYVNSGRSVRLKKGGGVPTQEKIGGSNHMVPFKCIDRPHKRGFQPPKLSPGSATSQDKKKCIPCIQKYCVRAEMYTHFVFKRVLQEKAFVFHANHFNIHNWYDWCLLLYNSHKKISRHILLNYK